MRTVVPPRSGGGYSAPTLLRYIGTEVHTIFGTSPHVRGHARRRRVVTTAVHAAVHDLIGDSKIRSSARSRLRGSKE